MFQYGFDKVMTYIQLIILSVDRITNNKEVELPKIYVMPDEKVVLEKEY